MCKTILSNGVKIVTQQVPNSQSISLGIWVKVGSRDEAPDEHGLSHFIEHLHFKGTINRSSRDISEAFEEIGGHLNAFTTKEYTCFYTKILRDHLNLASDVLCDIFFNSLYSSSDIEREKWVVIEEIKAIEDMPDEVIFDYFSSAFWDNHSLGRPVLGTSESVASFNRSKVINYLRRHYVAENIVIAAAGNLEHELIVDSFGKHFEKCVSSNKKKKYFAPEYNFDSIIIPRTSEQVYICLGTRGLSYFDPDRFSLMVLNNILGGSLSSRLFQQIREDFGLAYSVFSHNEFFYDCGQWCIHAGTSPERVMDVLKLTFSILKNVKRDGITISELEGQKSN